MSHSLQTLSDMYKRIDPVFSKNCRQLLRTFERCRLKAKQTANLGEPSEGLFTSMREFLSNHASFKKSYSTRAQHFHFFDPEKMLNDLGQLDRLVAHATAAISAQDNKDALIKFVQELL